MSVLEFTVTLAKPLPSAANLREHWAAKAKRVKAQRDQLRWAWLPHRHFGGVSAGAQHIAVTLTRIAPRRLDDDNLRSAFKAVRDEVAAVLGLDDGSERYVWAYGQEQGAAGYRVRIETEAA